MTGRLSVHKCWNLFIKWKNFSLHESSVLFEERLKYFYFDIYLVINPIVAKYTLVSLFDLLDIYWKGVFTKSSV